MKVKIRSTKMRTYSTGSIFLIPLLCYLLVAASSAQELQPSYTVVAPKIVRPNSDFLVAVSLHHIADEGGIHIDLLFIKMHSIYMYSFLLLDYSLFFNALIFNQFLAASQDVALVIRGRSETGQTIEIRQETTVSNEETQIVRIKIGDLGEGK